MTERGTNSHFLKKAIIVDMDGTMANVDHRLHHVREKRKDWKKFFEAMGEDELHEWCRFLTNNLPVFVIIMTGRPADYEDLTREWLKKNEIKFDLLLMRKAGDFRPDNIVKREIFDAKIKDKFEVLFVVDDRKSVVDMWRDLGLVCLQCQPGDF